MVQKETGEHIQVWLYDSGALTSYQNGDEPDWCCFDILLLVVAGSVRSVLASQSQAAAELRIYLVAIRVWCIEVNEFRSCQVHLEFGGFATATAMLFVATASVLLEYLCP